MEKFQETIVAAKRYVSTADHLVSVTYPLLNDPKLLLAVMDNIFLSLTNSMASILHHDRHFKKIPLFQDTFESKYLMFRDQSLKLHMVDKSYLNLMLEVKNTIADHRKSPMEFARKGSFVICSENYDIKTLSMPQIKLYVEKAKKFSELAEKIVTKND